ncbi:DNase I-like protein [Mycena kentingensis (nom. inval.)]|nr:DNase I-like protein [Mycena kentingensis (nom. inval.)]
MSAPDAGVLRAIIRPTDTVKVLLDAFVVPGAMDPATGAPESPPDAIALLADADRVKRASEDPRNRRLVAVVVHSQGTEEGSVFIMRARSTGKQLEQSDILRVFPVFGDFSISMAQIRRTTLMDSFRPSTTQPAPGFLSLTISQADAASTNRTPLTLYTVQAEIVRLLLAECKRLKQLADAPSAPSVAPILTTFSWLAPYTARRAPLPPLFHIPQDLRVARTPLHARLSPAFAGQPGDDASDVLRIRDEWIRVRAREEAGVGTTSLRIRIGTFNVNGELPRQDLSTWLGMQPYTSQQQAPIAPALTPLVTGLRKETYSTSLMSPGAITPVLSPVSPEGPTAPITPTTTSQPSPSKPSPSNLSSTAPQVSSPLAPSAHTHSPSARSSASTLRSKLLPEEADSARPDMIVLGFQELDLSTEALIYSGSSSAAREAAWMEGILAALGQGKNAEKEKGEKATGHYVKLASKQLVGMLIIALVRADLRSCFDEVRTAAAGTGLMGVMGNKGGTALRVRYTPPIGTTSHSRAPSIISTSSAKSTSSSATAVSSSSSAAAPTASQHIKPKLRKPNSTILTFVNSHLAAFDEMYERRNADYNELTKRLKFEIGSLVGGPGSDVLFSEVDTSLDVIPPTPTASSGAPMPPGTTCGVFESDVTFWMGDLNYRIDAPDADVRTVLASDDWEDGRFEALLQYDQLKAAMRDKKAFNTFEEGKITHFPTYRFNAGLLKDDLGYDTKRRPAWTDRVLWATNSFTRVQQTGYTGYPLYNISDHKPVSADFTVDMNVFDLPTAEKAADKLYRQLRGLEDAHEDHNSRVDLKIMDTNVDLGKIAYHTTMQKRVTVKNIGKIPCAYRLVALDDESAVHPDWLKVEPMTALLLPDELLQITLTPNITNDAAMRLNVDHKDLTCTLILHTVMGKDHFVAVSAEYVPTCFGNSLARLTRLPGPIRAGGELLAEERAVNAPREVMRLINWMMSSNIRMERVFADQADESIVQQIRECLDTGDDFPFTPSLNEDALPVAFGETLLRLLDSLPEPLVPAELQPLCVLKTSRDEAFEMLDSFAPAAVNVWISVTAFLHYVCQSSSDVEAKTNRVAALFTPVLLRDTANTVSPVGRRNFLLSFIRG